MVSIHALTSNDPCLNAAGIHIILPTKTNEEKMAVELQNEKETNVLKEPWRWST